MVANCESDSVFLLLLNFTRTCNWEKSQPTIYHVTLFALTLIFLTKSFGGDNAILFSSKSFCFESRALWPHFVYLNRIINKYIWSFGIQCFRKLKTHLEIRRHRCDACLNASWIFGISFTIKISTEFGLCLAVLFMCLASIHSAQPERGEWEKESLQEMKAVPFG